MVLKVLLITYSNWVPDLSVNRLGYWNPCILQTLPTEIWDGKTNFCSFT